MLNPRKKRKIDKRKTIETTEDLGTSAMHSRLHRLIELNAKTNKLIQLSYGDDDEQHPSNFLRNSAIGAGVAVPVGLYAAGAGAQGLGAGQVLKKAGQNLSTIGKGGITDIGSTISQGAGMIGNATRSTTSKGLDGLMALLQKARGVVKASAKPTGNEIKFSRVERLTRLNSQLSSVIEFGNPDPKKNRAVQVGVATTGLLGTAATLGALRERGDGSVIQGAKALPGDIAAATKKGVRATRKGIADALLKGGRAGSKFIRP